MLCLEGIARALNIFKGRVEAPQYRLADMTGELGGGIFCKSHLLHFVTCGYLTVFDGTLQPQDESGMMSSQRA